MRENFDNDDLERFRTGVSKYAAYLETPEGRLRLDLAFENLREFLPQSPQPLQGLDLGGGTGSVAIRLAKLGVYVTLLDASSRMLEFAERAADQAGVKERIALRNGDVSQLADLLPGASFDVVVCHNILEYLDDPSLLIQSAAGALRSPSGVISVLVRNQAGEVLKAAIKDGDLSTTEQNLTSPWVHESLYGGRVRLFTPENAKAMLQKASLELVAERGVRVVSDFLPPQISRTGEYERIFQLERRLGSRVEFAAIARYTQLLARPGHRG